MLKFIIERSKTQIYDRIAVAFGNELAAMGHSVITINDANMGATQFVDAVNDLKADCFLSTNEQNFIQAFDPHSNRFCFEDIKAKIIFVHHDNFLSVLKDDVLIQRKVNAYKAVAEKSFHFCIERDNVDEFRALGFNNIFHIWHASELVPQPQSRSYYGVSFVGHIFPDLSSYPLHQLPNAELHVDVYKQKINDLSTETNLLYKQYLAVDGRYDETDLKSFSKKQQWVGEFNYLTFPTRGEVLQSIKSEVIEIFGGDLTKSVERSSPYKIQEKRFKYYHPTESFQRVGEVYAASEFNINISAIQMDHAINPRIIDIGAAKGFLLTDWKDELPMLTSVAHEISFKAPSEVASKLENFRANPKLYEEVKQVFHNDISKMAHYRNACNKLVDVL
jgi:hypothetical protein